jgi:hypothetical protein
VHIDFILSSILWACPSPIPKCFHILFGFTFHHKIENRQCFLPLNYLTKHHTLQQPKILTIFPHNTFLKHLLPNTHTFLVLNTQNSMKTRIPHTHITYTCNTSKPTSTSTTLVTFCYKLICHLFPHLIHTFGFCDHIGTPFEKKLLTLLQVRKGKNKRKKKLVFV